MIAFPVIPRPFQPHEPVVILPELSLLEGRPPHLDRVEGMGSWMLRKFRCAQQEPPRELLHDAQDLLRAFGAEPRGKMGKVNERDRCLCLAPPGRPLGVHPDPRPLGLLRQEPIVRLFAQ